MIKLENVTKTYREGMFGRKVVGLRDLNLSISSGEVFGFLGPNGAGKSTTIKILLDLIRPDCGHVTINGGSVSVPQVRRNVGYLPENPYFYDYLTAEELLWFGGRSAGMSNREVRERSVELLQQVNLADAGSRRLRTYSKGMVQRAGLALALIHDPQVVILDEPMSGLDPLGRKMVVDLILDLKKRGKTVFFSSHILADIERICDRVGIIAQGDLRRVARLDELTADGRGLEKIFIETVQPVAEGLPS
jgi:ABC-2 type transport system ATP-binding protein